MGFGTNGAHSPQCSRRERISTSLVTLLHRKFNRITMLSNVQINKSNYGISYAPPYVPIAPTPDRRHLNLELSNSDATERRYNYKSAGLQAASIARRNARERNRVKQVNDGFNALRKRLPVAIVNALSGGARRGSGKKLSKVDTLRMVVEYIRHLQSLLGENGAVRSLVTHKSSDNIDLGKAVAHYEIDEGIFGGRASPYSDSVPSPANSDCSSGISSIYSNNDCYSYNYATNVETASNVNENELLDAISWWQQK